MPSLNDKRKYVLARLFVHSVISPNLIDNCVSSESAISANSTLFSVRTFLIFSTIIIAYDFTQMPEYLVDSLFGITGVRTWKELQGIPCIEFEDGFEAKQSICVSRSFSSEIYDVKELQEQLANFASTMAEKLRKQGSAVAEMLVFAHANRFKENQPQDYANALVAFMTPTADQRTIISHAVQAVQNLCKKNCGYKKAGVIATKIVAETNVMRSLFEDTDLVKRENSITAAVDAINNTFGKGTIKLAVQGSGRIKTTSENQSPHYTTKWSDLPHVTVK